MSACPAGETDEHKWRGSSYTLGLVGSLYLSIYSNVCIRCDALQKYDGTVVQREEGPSAKD